MIVFLNLILKLSETSGPTCMACFLAALLPTLDRAINRQTAGLQGSAATLFRYRTTAMGAIGRQRMTLVLLRFVGSDLSTVRVPDMPLAAVIALVCDDYFACTLTDPQRNALGQSNARECSFAITTPNSWILPISNDRHPARSLLGSGKRHSRLIANGLLHPSQVGLMQVGLVFLMIAKVHCFG